MYWLLPYSRL